MTDMLDYYEEVLLLRKKLAKFEKLDRQKRNTLKGSGNNR